MQRKLEYLAVFLYALRGTTVGRIQSVLVLIRTVDIERGNAGIMLIAGHYGKIVSEGRRGNPNVIIGYKKPLGAKVRAYCKFHRRIQHFSSGEGSRFQALHTRRKEPPTRVKRQARGPGDVLLRRYNPC